MCEKSSVMLFCLYHRLHFPLSSLIYIVSSLLYLSDTFKSNKQYTLSQEQVRITTWYKHLAMLPHNHPIVSVRYTCVQTQALFPILPLSTSHSSIFLSSFLSLTCTFFLVLSFSVFVFLGLAHHLILFLSFSMEANWTVLEIGLNMF